MALRSFRLALLLLTVVSCASELFCKFVLHLNYPYTWPLIAPTIPFVDLVRWMPSVAGMHTEAFFHNARHVLYPAPGIAIFWFFSLAGPYVVTAYRTLAALFLTAVLWLLGREFLRSGLSVSATTSLLVLMLATSYPLWILLHTANIELIVWLLILLGLWAFSKRRLGWAAVCFGIAGAIKLYPLAYLLLFLDLRRPRTWLRAVQGTAVALLVTLASLWCLSPHLARSWDYVHQGNIRFLQEDGLALRSGIVGYDHTLWALLKVITPDTTPEHRAPFLVLFLVAAGLSVTLLWFFRVRRLPLVNRVLFVTLASIWLTPTSYDYTLLHLYAPWALLALACVRGEVANRTPYVAFGCFAVLFTAQGYVIREATLYAAQAKSFSLFVLLALSFAAPLVKRNLSVSR